MPMDYFDLEAVQPLLAAIRDGQSLLADNHNGGFRVWTYLGNGEVGSGPYEVPWSDLYAIKAQHRDAVIIHGGPVVY